MRVQQSIWHPEQQWQNLNKTEVHNPQLVLFFAAPALLKDHAIYRLISERYQGAHVIGCSTAGEIVQDEVWDDSVVVSAIEFARTPIQVVSVEIGKFGNSLEAGKELGRQLSRDGLRGVLVISEGLQVNGSDLVRGLGSELGPEVPITGGLAADGPHFGTTWVSCDAEAQSGCIAVVGFYGDHINFGHGCVGGWDVFGPERVITRSEGNVLYELDGKPALDLYKKYLGEQADNLPASGLLFPLMIRQPDKPDSGLVRTLLGVNEQDKSMTFAGDIPYGHIGQLMRVNFERLIDGAGTAARIAGEKQGSGDRLAVLISCVGRKMILGHRTVDEVEAVQELLGPEVAQIGFYSYGEISPHRTTGSCELHNQTMTITVLSEN